MNRYRRRGLPPRPASTLFPLHQKPYHWTQQNRVKTISGGRGFGMRSKTNFIQVERTRELSPPRNMSVMSLRQTREVFLLVRRGSCFRKLDFYFSFIFIRAVRQWVPISTPI